MIFNMNGSEAATISALVVIERENEKLSDLPYAFANGSLVEYEGELHILGGSGSSSQTKHYKLNKDTRLWESVSTLSYSHSSGSAVVYRGEIHLLGGVSGLNQHWKLNKTSGKWEQLDNLPYNFSKGDAVVKDDCIHLLGSDISPYTQHYKFNGTSWTPDVTLPYGFKNGSAVVKDNEIRLLGTDAGNNYKAHWKLNKTTNEWQQLVSIPVEFYGTDAVVYGDKIHLLGTQYGSDMQVHYVLNDEWDRVDDIPYSLREGKAISYGSAIHLLGGQSGVSVNRYHWILQAGKYIEGNVKANTSIYCPYDTFYNSANTVRHDDTFRVLEDGLVSIGVSGDIPMIQLPDMEWKSLGYISGEGKLTYPEEFNELLMIAMEANGTQLFSKILSRIELSVLKASTTTDVEIALLDSIASSVTKVFKLKMEDRSIYFDGVSSNNTFRLYYR